MIAYSRGSQTLAGAASLKNRMPATVGTFSIHSDVAQWQSNRLIICGPRVRRPLSKPLCVQLNRAIQA